MVHGRPGTSRRRTPVPHRGRSPADAAGQALAARTWWSCTPSGAIPPRGRRAGPPQGAAALRNCLTPILWSARLPVRGSRARAHCSSQLDRARWQGDRRAGPAWSSPTTGLGHLKPPGCHRPSYAQRSVGSLAGPDRRALTRPPRLVRVAVRRFGEVQANVEPDRGRCGRRTGGVRGWTADEFARLCCNSRRGAPAGPDRPTGTADTTSRSGARITAGRAQLPSERMA